MHQSVTDHSRSYALGREPAIVLTGTVCQYSVEHISHQFSDGGTDIPQYLLTAGGTFHRNTCQQRKIRHQIISTAFLKFRRKVITPVLTATLPTVYVHIFQYTACHGFIRLFEHFRKPVRELFLNSLVLNLSHSNPLPPPAVAFTCPVAVCPMRRIRHLPSGKRAVSLPDTKGD